MSKQAMESNSSRQDEMKATAATTEDARPLLLVRIRSLVPSMTPSEKTISEFILSDPTKVSALTIAQLAAATGTSEATIIRYCRRVGLTGYAELRIALAEDLGRLSGWGPQHELAGADVDSLDGLREIVAKVTATDAVTISETGEQLDIVELEKAVDVLAEHQRIEIYGIGTSRLVALDLEQKLRRLGLRAHATMDGHEAVSSAALATPEEVVIGISHSGETIDTVEPFEHAANRGATTIAITNYPESRLAEVADIVLTTAVRESIYRAGATASPVAQLTLIDCLYVGLGQRNRTAALKSLRLTGEALQSRVPGRIAKE